MKRQFLALLLAVLLTVLAGCGGAPAAPADPAPSDPSTSAPSQGDTANPDHTANTPGSDVPDDYVVGEDHAPVAFEAFCTEWVSADGTISLTMKDDFGFIYKDQNKGTDIVGDFSYDGLEVFLDLGSTMGWAYVNTSGALTLYGDDFTYFLKSNAPVSIDVPFYTPYEEYQSGQAGGMMDDFEEAIYLRSLHPYGVAGYGEIDREASQDHSFILNGDWMLPDGGSYYRCHWPYWSEFSLKGDMMGMETDGGNIYLDTQNPYCFYFESMQSGKAFRVILTDAVTLQSEKDGDCIYTPVDELYPD